jgi:hypothetical protein
MSANKMGFSQRIASFACGAALIMLATASPAADAVGEEPAVWKAIVEFIASDNASRPYKQLYFQTDFETSPLVTNSMAIPRVANSRNSVACRLRIRGRWCRSFRR